MEAQSEVKRLSTRRERFRFLALGVQILVLTTVLHMLSEFSLARADQYFWKNPSGGFWGVANNWNPADVPGPTDEAHIGDLSALSYINLGGGIDVGLLTFGKTLISGTGDITAGSFLTGDGILGKKANETLTFARSVTIRTNGYFGGVVSTGRLIVNQGVVTNAGVVFSSLADNNQFSVGEIPGWHNEPKSVLILASFTNAISFRQFNVDPAAPPPAPELYPWITNSN